MRCTGLDEFSAVPFGPAVHGLDDDRRAQSRLAHSGNNAQAVEIGHAKIEHDGVDLRSAVAEEDRHRGLPAAGKKRIVTGTTEHVLDERRCTGSSSTMRIRSLMRFAHAARGLDLCRFGALSRVRLKARLNRAKYITALLVLFVLGGLRSPR